MAASYQVGDGAHEDAHERSAVSHRVGRHRVADGIQLDKKEHEPI
ncbi:hypothetical protein [Bacillus paralicheniformis]|nr:hypothetical protein [Bacillus paralicheniformis]